MQYSYRTLATLPVLILVLAMKWLQLGGRFSLPFNPAPPPPPSFFFLGALGTTYLAQGLGSPSYTFHAFGLPQTSISRCQGPSAKDAANGLSGQSSKGYTCYSTLLTCIP